MGYLASCPETPWGGRRAGLSATQPDLLHQTNATPVSSVEMRRCLGALDLGALLTRAWARGVEVFVNDGTSCIFFCCKYGYGVSRSWGVGAVSLGIFRRVVFWLCRVKMTDFL